MRTALEPGEDCGVYQSRHVFFGVAVVLVVQPVLLLAHDYGPSRSAQSLVGCRGDHIGERKRRLMDTTDNQPGDVADVGQMVGVYFLTYLLELIELKLPGIGG